MAPRAALAGLRPGFLLAPEPYFAHLYTACMPVQLEDAARGWMLAGDRT
jgi:histidinol-phosphate/aromatic aminotransferase/cobyric acid decarboxylase-like protein